MRFLLALTGIEVEAVKKGFSINARVSLHGDVLDEVGQLRLSLLAGPFAWLDWLPQLWGERRWLLDRLPKTKVIAQRSQGQPRAVPARPPAVP